MIQPGMALSNPRRYVSSFERLFDDLFDSRFLTVAPRVADESGVTTWRPTCDVRETNNAYIIDAEIPGARKEDIKLEIEGNQLRLSGEVNSEKTEEDERLSFRERTFGSFMRTFTLPQNAQVDNITAKHENGLLKLFIPKSEPKPAEKRKTINIQ